MLRLDSDVVTSITHRQSEAEGMRVNIGNDLLRPSFVYLL